MKKKFYYSNNQKTAALPIKLPGTVGIIIKATYLDVAIPTDKGTNTQVKRVGTITSQLEQMAQDFHDQGIEHIAISVAGPYWMHIFNLLTDKGFKVCLVNPAQIRQKQFKNLTYGENCQRLQQLHSYGLTIASFIPEKIIQTLREYMKLRKKTQVEKMQHLQQIGAALIKMNILLPHAFSDLEGVTSMAIIRAIAEGNKDPKNLAAIRDTIPNTHNIKINYEYLVEVLKGSYAKEQLFIINKNLSKYDCCKKIMQDCDREMEKALWEYVQGDQFDINAFTEDESEHLRKNQVSARVLTPVKQIIGVDLSLIDGLSNHTILMILCRIGWSVKAWESSAKFVSWLGLAPDEEKSHKTPNEVAQAFRLAARSLHNSKTYMGMLYQEILAKTRCVAKTIKAIARQLAIDFYELLTKGEEEFKKKKMFLQQKMENKIAAREAGK